jgi:uncharacterized protein YjbJ (UPF0337 family)
MFGEHAPSQAETGQPHAAFPPVSKTRRNVVDWNRVEGNWKQMKGKFKEQGGNFTDDDLDVINGKRDQLEGKIQARYGYEKDRTKKDVDDWYNGQKW